MRTCALTVDIYCSLVIHGTEVQEHRAGALLLCQGDGSAVPYAVEKVLDAYAGEFTFRAEGDQDLAAVGGVGLMKPPGFTGTALIDLKIPGAVEVYPVVTPELGLGMFAARNHRDTLL
jgi:hypothetical protein